MFLLLGGVYVQNDEYGAKFDICSSIGIAAAKAIFWAPSKCYPLYFHNMIEIFGSATTQIKTSERVARFEKSEGECVLDICEYLALDFEVYKAWWKNAT